MLGFSGDRAAKQRALEAKLDAAVDAAEIGEWIKVLSARPHHLGSPYDKENAERIAALFRSWGYDTAIEEFQVLFPTPKERHLELVAPTRFQARSTRRVRCTTSPEYAPTYSTVPAGSAMDTR